MKGKIKVILVVLGLSSCNNAVTDFRERLKDSISKIEKTNVVNASKNSKTHDNITHMSNGCCELTCKEFIDKLLSQNKQMVEINNETFNSVQTAKEYIICSNTVSFLSDSVSQLLIQQNPEFMKIKENYLFNFNKYEIIYLIMGKHLHYVSKSNLSIEFPEMKVIYSPNNFSDCRNICKIKK